MLEKIIYESKPFLIAGVGAWGFQFANGDRMIHFFCASLICIAAYYLWHRIEYRMTKRPY